MLVYVDPQVVVVNKTAGINTVPFEPGERGTLNQLVAGLLPRTHGKGPPSSLGVVQRLDRETSGLLVFLRTFEDRQILAAWLGALGAPGLPGHRPRKHCQTDFSQPPRSKPR